MDLNLIFEGFKLIIELLFLNWGEFIIIDWVYIEMTMSAAQFNRNCQNFINLI